MAFNGTFDHTLDAKNRLTMPAKYRSLLAGGVILVRAPGPPCLSLYLEPVWTELVDRSLAGRNPLHPETQEMRHLIHSRSDDMELDGAGRITLQARHLEYARIQGREVVITGGGDCLHVWDRATARAHDADADARLHDLFSSLGHPA